MAVHLYIMPTVLELINGEPTQNPKYLSLLGEWDGWTYGREGTVMLGSDMSVANHTTLSGMSDVITLPDNLDTLLGSTFNAINNQLENRFLTLSGLSGASPYRDAIRRVAAQIVLGQKIEAFRFASNPNTNKHSLFADGIALNTTYGALNAGDQATLVSAYDSFGFSKSLLVSATTMRQLLVDFALQWGARGVMVMGVVI